MSAVHEKIKLYIDTQKINRNKNELKFPDTVFSSRTFTSSVSPRNKVYSIRNSVRRLSSVRPIYPYPGLNIGYIKLEKRISSSKNHNLPATNYTHFFSDMYLNSETLSFSKEENSCKIPSDEQNNYHIPSKINFRRLKRKSWAESKNKEADINAITNIASRSVGKAYNNVSVRKKELLPLTKFNSKKIISDSLSLRIRGVLKTFK